MCGRMDGAGGRAASLTSAQLKRIVQDLREVERDAPEGVCVSYDEENLSQVYADVAGPVGTPYAGGVFRVRLDLAEFPEKAPKGWMLTKIFHPNIARNGEICVNTIKRDWSPEHGLRHILAVIRCLLIEPNAESALNEEAGKQLLDDYAGFAEYARTMTEIHAMPKAGANPLGVNTGAENGVMLEADKAALKKAEKAKAKAQAKAKKSMQRL